MFSRGTCSNSDGLHACTVSAKEFLARAMTCTHQTLASVSKWTRNCNSDTARRCTLESVARSQTFGHVPGDLVGHRHLDFLCPVCQWQILRRHRFLNEELLGRDARARTHWVGLHSSHITSPHLSSRILSSFTPSSLPSFALLSLPPPITQTDRGVTETKRKEADRNSAALVAAIVPSTREHPLHRDSRHGCNVRRTPSNLGAGAGERVCNSRKQVFWQRLQHGLGCWRGKGTSA